MIASPTEGPKPFLTRSYLFFPVISQSLQGSKKRKAQCKCKLMRGLLGTFSRRLSLSRRTWGALPGKPSRYTGMEAYSICQVVNSHTQSFIVYKSELEVTWYQHFHLICICWVIRWSKKWPLCQTHLCFKSIKKIFINGIKMSKIIRW